MIPNYWGKGVTIDPLSDPPAGISVDREGLAQRATERRAGAADPPDVATCKKCRGTS